MPLDQLPPGPPAEVQIAFLLTRLGNKQSSGFAELLGPLELRPKQFAVMNIVALADGPSQHEIGASMELDPSGLISTIDELEGRGWLERRQSQRDRRRNVIYLTDAGNEKLSEARAAALARANDLTGSLTKKERATLLTLLRKLAAPAAKR